MRRYFPRYSAPRSLKFHISAPSPSYPSIASGASSGDCYICPCFAATERQTDIERNDPTLQIDLLFDILAGLPSIVIGLFGFSLAVFLNRNFPGRLPPCLLLSSLALAFLVLPYLIRTTQTALESLPAQSRMTALALGASRLQNILHVLLPQTLPAMMSGVILAIGRCAEDTAVIMLTGVVASTGVPRSLLSHYEALPFHIYYISSQYSDQQELATGYGAAILLLFICLLLFFAAFLIKKGLAYQALYRA